MRTVMAAAAAMLVFVDMVFLRFEISNDDSRDNLSRPLAEIFSSGQEDWRRARPSRFMGILKARRAGRKPV
jgi:hypothetical protein